MNLLKPVASILICLTTFIVGTIDSHAGEPPATRPNVVLIMTDDQGIGDLGVMHNPIIETPNIDALAGQSAWLTRFYVHPVCTPTRACLMTGRYNYRTRAIDTYLGRAMMEPSEVTIAEILVDAGYATGIFGKWHLGDCYPMRAMDQGFQTAVVHRGGGIGQPSDPLQAERQYTNPTLMRNGAPEHFEGYCTDVYYDEALRFIESSHAAGRPFFVYLPDNCPHGPFHDVPQDLYELYKQKNLSADQFPQQKGHPIPERQNLETLARIYAMIGNVDRNVGRVLHRLDQLQMAKDTIVIFMCDNGPNSQRYVMGMRGHKGSVYEGGIRSPFFVRWPGKFPAALRLDQPAAHIDVLPTLLEACGVNVPQDLQLDGISLYSSLTGQQSEPTERTIFIQSHRGNQPVRYHHFAARNERWKLLHPSGFGKQGFQGQPKFELYDVHSDPLETRDVAAQNPQVVAEMRQAYDAWFDDVGNTRPNNYDPPRIVLGSQHEDSTVLTRQDWRRTKGNGWGTAGRWLVTIAETGAYDFRLRLPRNQPRQQVQLYVGDDLIRGETDSSGLNCDLQNIPLETGDVAIRAQCTGGGEPVDVYQIEVSKR